MNGINYSRPKQTFFLISVAILLFSTISCESVPTDKDTFKSSVSLSNKQPTPEDIRFVQDFVKEFNFSHIIVTCFIYDLSFKLVKRLPKSHCWPEPNGDVIIHLGQKLERLDKNAFVLWSKEPILLQHVLSKSVIKDEFLALNSIYTKENGVLSRYDQLLIFNGRGKTLRSFSFADFYKLHPERRPEGVQNSWAPDANINKSVEYTHGNSFAEVFTEKNGSKKLVSYAYFSIYEKNIFFFDPELKKIISQFYAGRDLHNVHQISENNLIAYANANDKDPFGSIQLIDLKKNAMTTLYQFTDPRQASSACSSVQRLSDDKYFILHSKCMPHEKSLEAGFEVEFVNLKTKENAIIHFSDPPAPQGGRLTNLTAFLGKIKY